MWLGLEEKYKEKRKDVGTEELEEKLEYLKFAWCL